VIDNNPTRSYLTEITVVRADLVQVALNQPERATFSGVPEAQPAGGGMVEAPGIYLGPEE
jgi:hypothetical protein